MTSWLAPVAAFGAELLRGVPPAFCTQCPWGLVLLGLVLACCAGACLGAIGTSVVLSPLVRRAIAAALHTLLGSGAFPYRPPSVEEVRRRLGAYPRRQVVYE